MHDFLISIENMGVSTYIRESDWGFPTVITAHAFAYWVLRKAFRSSRCAGCFR